MVSCTIFHLKLFNLFVVNWVVQRLSGFSSWMLVHATAPAAKSSMSLSVCRRRIVAFRRSVLKWNSSLWPLLGTVFVTFMQLQPLLVGYRNLATISSPFLSVELKLEPKVSEISFSLSLVKC